MPQPCCVVGCSIRKVKGTKLSFYPIPSGTTAFEKKRREDWMKKTDHRNKISRNIFSISRGKADIIL